MNTTLIIIILALLAVHWLARVATCEEELPEDLCRRYELLRWWTLLLAFFVTLGALIYWGCVLGGLPPQGGL